MSRYTELTLRHLRSRGWRCQVVERFQFHSQRRVDLFGIIDIIAIRDGRIAGVQSTGWAGRRPHLLKLTETNQSDLKECLDSGMEVYLISWKKQKVKRGGVAFRYVPVIDGWIRRLEESRDPSLRPNPPPDSEQSPDEPHS